MLDNDIFGESSSSSYTQEVINIVRLIRSENVGIRTFFHLIKFFGTAAKALNHVKDLAKEGGRKTPIKVCSADEVMQEIEQLNKIGARLLTYLDPEYSRLLLQIADPPPVISYIGNKQLLNDKSIAVVGARNASLNGLAFAGKIAGELSKRQFTVVSGLARGIDTVAHRSCIDLKTIAVLAGGIDHIYPQENRELYKQIGRQGLLVAELPFGVAPLSRHFPQRNRIISGLCVATVVVEANLKSGSLVTARYALEQNREIFAVPGFPLDPRSQGTNKLIREGAHILESVEDILHNLPAERQATLKAEEDQHQDLSKFNQYDMGNVDNNMREQIFELLSNTPISVEAIAQVTSLPMPIIYLIILELELAGKVLRINDGRIQRVYD